MVDYLAASWVARSAAGKVGHSVEKSAAWLVDLMVVMKVVQKAASKVATKVAQSVVHWAEHWVGRSVVLMAYHSAEMSAAWLVDQMAE